MKLKMNLFSLYGLLTIAGLVLAFSQVQEPPFIKELKQQLAQYIETKQDKKMYLQLDRKLYKPGEDLWFTAYLRDANSLQKTNQTIAIEVILNSPSGSKVAQLSLDITSGQAKGDFALPTHLKGGIYTLKAQTLGRGEKLIFEREITIQKAVLPHLKMQLQFERKAFGAGDEVIARLDLHALDNRALSEYDFTYVAQLDGQTILKQQATTDKKGRAYVQFLLPEELTSNDGLLQILIPYQGQRESISRAIPIVLNDIDIQFFPEGGDAIVGINQRIAFKAINEFGKPADIEGVIENSQGEIVQSFSSFHQGMGAFELTPEKEELYCAKITQPAGIQEVYPLHEIWERGYNLQVQEVTNKNIKVQVYSTEREAVYLVAQARGEIFHSEKINLSSKPKEWNIPIKDLAIGIVQVTLFDTKKIERCERLVFVHQDKQLNISVKTNKEKYLPREKVKMTIQVKDERGMPMPGDFSLAVVDDKLLTFADDKQSHILSAILLEADLTGEIVEPNFYFDKTEPKAAQALDYLLMTQGWRRFKWDEVRQAIASKEALAAQQQQQKNQKIFHDMPPQTEDIIIEPPRTAEPPPPPPPPMVIEEIPEEEIMDEEEVEFVDQTVEENMVIEQPAPAVQLGAPPPPPPPPPPPAPKVEEIFKVVESMPRFPGCEHLESVAERNKCSQANMVNFIYKNLKYPAIARENAIEGTVVIRFVVEKNGEIVEAQVVRDIGAQCGAEALKVIQKMQREYKNWTPGKQRGNPVRVQYHVPVKFKLDATNDYEPYGYYPSTAQRVREFYAPKYEDKAKNPVRTDFRSTIYWNPHIQVDRRGKTVIEFYNSDAISSFKATIEGFSTDGGIGRATQQFYTQLPFGMMVKVPPTVLMEDKVSIPLTLTNHTKKTLTGDLQVQTPQHFTAMATSNNAASSVSIEAESSKTIFLTYQVGHQLDTSDFKISFVADGLSDVFTTAIETEARGFPVEEILTAKALKHDFNIHIQAPIEGSIKAKLVAHTNVMSEVLTGLDRLLRQPYGCFEQTSSANYPNLLVLDYLKSTHTLAPEVEKKARDFLTKGYDRLLGFECKNGGFEWYGREPAHEALSAYGLLEFVDMSQVFQVEPALIQRTAQWLLSRIDGEGSWKRSNKTLHTWDAKTVGDAYVVWALSVADYGRQISKETNKAYQAALESGDPYLKALMSNALFAQKDKRSDILLQQLLKTQAPNGHWQGQSSITHSGERARAIEATSLVVLAMLESKKVIPHGQLKSAIDFLLASKTARGFGNTQSTVLAMKALVAYAKIKNNNRESGKLKVFINDQMVASHSYKSDDKDAIEIEGLGQYLKIGNQTISVEFEGTQQPLPIDVELTYHTRLPLSNEACAVQISTKLKQAQLQMGATNRLTCQIKNTKIERIHSPIALIGIPAGLSLQTWQLKELQEQNAMDYYELYEGYLVLHYEQLPAGAERTIHLDLKADIPGTYEAPASSAYLYYDQEKKSWAAAERVVVAP